MPGKFHFVHRPRPVNASARVRTAMAEPLKAYAHNLLVFFADERDAAASDHLLLTFRGLIVREPLEKARGALKRWFRAWKATSPGPINIPLPAEEIQRNVEVLRDGLNLKEHEVALVLFLAAARTVGPLLRLLGLLGGVTEFNRIDLIGAATGVDSALVESAIGPNGNLHAVGLVVESAEEEIVLLESFRELIITPGLTAARLLDRVLPEADAPTLSHEDFVSLAENIKIGEQLLLAAHTTRQPGVNILLHGSTGLGKSEFARLIASAIGLKLHVAGAVDSNGEAPDANERLSSLLLGHRLFAGSQSVLLFDELEDLFEWDFSSAGSKARMSKQWFNRLLETNAVPTIWITNETEGIDPAFLRRFSFAIEFRKHGPQQRARVLRRHLGSWIKSSMSDADVKSVAQRFEATPAQLQTAVAAARLIMHRVDRPTLEQLIAPMDELLHGRKASTLAFDAATYRVDVLNASEDLSALADRLCARRTTGLSLCLYGPPGTGKSEWAKWLAWRMDKPLICKRASDLESCWVGETEKNISTAFREAQEERAVLLFDEADSWLRDRRSAVRSWEVTQVNEFLQQLESHQGLVICTTNLWNELDQAALRRFQFKVEFRYLTTDAACGLFEAMFGAADVRAQIEKMPPLTPGDFAVVSRRMRALGPDLDRDELLHQLEAETLARSPVRRQAGFVAVGQ